MPDVGIPAKQNTLEKPSNTTPKKNPTKKKTPVKVKTSVKEKEPTTPVMTKVVSETPKKVKEAKGGDKKYEGKKIKKRDEDKSIRKSSMLRA